MPFALVAARSPLGALCPCLPPHGQPSRPLGKRIPFQPYEDEGSHTTWIHDPRSLTRSGDGS